MPRVVIQEVRGCSVNFIWAPSPNARQSGVSKYHVMIMGRDGKFYPLPDQCDTSGSVLSCIVTMNVLSEAPYNLKKGAGIVAKAKATNKYG